MSCHPTYHKPQQKFFPMATYPTQWFLAFFAHGSWEAQACRKRHQWSLDPHKWRTRARRGLERNFLTQIARKNIFPFVETLWASWNFSFRFQHLGAQAQPGSCESLWARSNNSRSKRLWANSSKPDLGWREEAEKVLERAISEFVWLLLDMGLLFAFDNTVGALAISSSY